MRRVYFISVFGINGRDSHEEREGKERARLLSRYDALVRTMAALRETCPDGLRLWAVAVSRRTVRLIVRLRQSRRGSALRAKGASLALVAPIRELEPLLSACVILDGVSSPV
ncbi:hypothetical protein MRX96_019076 [Rhipicephalus microplus]